MAKEPADSRHDPLAFAAEMIERAEREADEPSDAPDAPSAPESAAQIETEETIESVAATEAAPAAGQPEPGPAEADPDLDADHGSDELTEHADPEDADLIDDGTPEARSRRRVARTKRQSAMEKRRRDR